MDVFLIDGNDIEGESTSVEEIYQKGFRDQPFLSYYKNYPFDVTALLAATPEEAVTMIQKGYEPFRDQFICYV